MPLWVPEWVVSYIGRAMCRLFRAHNVTCRGRADHFVAPLQSRREARVSLALQTSPLGLPLGARAPRVSTHPASVDSYGPEAIELMRRAGQPLDLWQQDLITAMLAVRDDGKWSCFELGVGLIDSGRWDRWPRH